MDDKLHPSSVNVLPPRLQHCCTITQRARMGAEAPNNFNFMPGRWRWNFLPGPSLWCIIKSYHIIACRAMLFCVMLCYDMLCYGIVCVCYTTSSNAGLHDTVTVTVIVIVYCVVYRTILHYTGYWTVLSLLLYNSGWLYCSIWPVMVYCTMPDCIVTVTVIVIALLPDTSFVNSRLCGKLVLFDAFPHVARQS